MTEQEYHDGVLRELRGIRAELAALVKELRAQRDEPGCPKCGSVDLEDTGTMAGARVTCHGCGVSFQPTEAVMHG